MIYYDGKRVGRIFFLGEEIDYAYINASDELREWLKFLFLDRTQIFLDANDPLGVVCIDSNDKWKIS